MPDPKIFIDWRIAKQAAAYLANACKATLLQTTGGKPRVIVGKKIFDCQTWAGAWSVLYRIRCDQIGHGRPQEPPAPAPTQPLPPMAETIPWAIILPDDQAKPPIPPQAKRVPPIVGILAPKKKT